MSVCLVGLGSNLGDRGGSLDEALVRLQFHADIEVSRQSRYHETLPVGGPDAQPAYLNAAAVLNTSLSPQALLAELQRVETELGRRRSEHWGPRTIDLDLLLYDNLAWTGPNLVIPHPRMAWRRFVLEPAAEVAPDMLHPGTGWTIAQLLDHLNQTPWYLAIAGPIGVGKSCLAGEIAERSGARLLAEEFDLARLEAFYHNPSSLAWQIELEFLEDRAA
jgi:2-amino-4-hydroxy-6-hydroxymethyldihydropteridine diphosphokinase